MKVVAICGGVGGAKLAVGLTEHLPDLAIIVNTGDDFVHYGLPICPDLDTVAYTLAGKVHRAQGWGRADERFSVREELEALGEQPWFLLGDRDIALHLLRARLLGEGKRLTQAMALIGERLGVRARLIPMSDTPAPTVLVTRDGTALPFQDYFVRLRCEPALAEIRYGGTGAAPSPEALAALTDPALDAIIFCPSNPFLSVAPILAIPAIRDAIQRRTVPAIAISPLIAGEAVKGPTAKICRELGMAPSVRTVARFYQGIADTLVIDRADEERADEPRAMGFTVAVASTLMTDRDSKANLARFCLDLIQAAALRP